MRKPINHLRDIALYKFALNCRQRDPLIYWLYKGYLAWKGEHYEEMVDMLMSCKIQTVDVDRAEFIFYYIESEEESLYFTNGLYGGLTGYTVATAVPEPSTYALIALSLLVGVISLRNRSQKNV